MAKGSEGTDFGPKQYAIVGVVIVLFGGLFYFLQGGGSQVGQDPNFHIHPSVEIIICGNQVPLQKNWGNEFFHTHDDVPIVHYEFKHGNLGDFFNQGGVTRFNSTCINGYCNGEGKCGGSGTVSMTVNGRPNYEFERYVPNDGDRIVITYQ